MISDDFYDLALAFIAIVLLFGLHVAHAPGWLSGFAMGMLLLLVVLKDRLFHQHLHRTRN